MFELRYERPEDISGIRKVNEAAFETKAVVVLGYPEYYPRFGFVPSVEYNIKSEYDVPPEVFMIKELRSGALTGISGIAKFHEAFAEL